MKKNTLKGFTALEIVLVLSIIIILGLIIYSPYQKAKRKEQDIQKIVDMKNLQTSLISYAEYNGQYPSSLLDLEKYQDNNSLLKINKTDKYNPDLYNYTPFLQNGKVIGFHIWTHLKLSSSLPKDSANCVGVVESVPSDNDGTPINSPCFIGKNITEPNLSSAGSIPDNLNSKINFAPATRIHDNDSSCINDVFSCIYDIKS